MWSENDIYFRSVCVPYRTWYRYRYTRVTCDSTGTLNKFNLLRTGRTVLSTVPVMVETNINLMSVFEFFLSADDVPPVVYKVHKVTAEIAVCLLAAVVCTCAYIPVYTIYSYHSHYVRLKPQRSLFSL
jgi:hypothetical protein